MCGQHIDLRGLLLVHHSLYNIGDLEDVCWLLKQIVSIIDEEKRGAESGEEKGREENGEERKGYH